MSNAVDESFSSYTSYPVASIDRDTCEVEERTGFVIFTKAQGEFTQEEVDDCAKLVRTFGDYHLELIENAENGFKKNMAERRVELIQAEIDFLDSHPNFVFSEFLHDYYEYKKP